MNANSYEESKSEFDLNDGSDSLNEESQQSAFVWENNLPWPKSVFRFSPISRSFFVRH